MATEQLPAAQYLIAGQATITNYEIIDDSRSFVEDTEDKSDSDGQHKAKITYSRRETVSITADAEAAATPKDYLGGEIASGIIAREDGTASAWNILNATITKTRGVQQVQLELIEQLDQL